MTERPANIPQWVQRTITDLDYNFPSAWSKSLSIFKIQLQNNSRKWCRISGAYSILSWFCCIDFDHYLVFMCFCWVPPFFIEVQYKTAWIPLLKNNQETRCNFSKFINDVSRNAHILTEGFQFLNYHFKQKVWVQRTLRRLSKILKEFRNVIAIKRSGQCLSNLCIYYCINLCS